MNFLKGIFKPTIYDKCENMPLWNFQKYLETNDLRYFTKEHKYHNSLPEVMSVFFGEYIELTNNRSAINRFEVMYKIMCLQAKYRAVTLILKALWNYPKDLPIDNFKALADQLQKWNYRIDCEKDIFSQLEKIHQRLQGILTQVELLEAQLQTDDAKESKSIEGQLISVSRALDLRYQLNAKEITVLQWVEFCKQVDLLAKERQRQAVKKK